MVGINIQTPWSGLLINGSKTVETRSYHLPFKYLGVELALVETPGKSGRFKSRIIGTITFSESFKYDNKQHWMEDYLRHKVDVADENYGWGNKAKYGWVVSHIKKFDKPVDISKRKGIIFTTGLLENN